MESIDTNGIEDIRKKVPRVLERIVDFVNKFF